jgi:Flp pilus assembly pilin Flp
MRKLFCGPARFPGWPSSRFPAANKLARRKGRRQVRRPQDQFLSDDRGQDVAEYAIMLAVILVIVVGTVRLIGANAGNVFSSVGSAIQ